MNVCERLAWTGTFCLKNKVYNQKCIANHDHYLFPVWQKIMRERLAPRPWGFFFYTLLYIETKLNNNKLLLRLLHNRLDIEQRI